MFVCTSLTSHFTNKHRFAFNVVVAARHEPNSNIFTVSIMYSVSFSFLYQRWIQLFVVLDLVVRSNLRDCFLILLSFGLVSRISRRFPLVLPRPARDIPYFSSSFPRWPANAPVSNVCCRAKVLHVPLPHPHVPPQLVSSYRPHPFSSSSNTSLWIQSLC